MACEARQPQYLKKGVSGFLWWHMPGKTLLWGATLENFLVIRNGSQTPQSSWHTLPSCDLPVYLCSPWRDPHFLFSIVASQLKLWRRFLVVLLMFLLLRMHPIASAALKAMADGLVQCSMRDHGDT